jgi:hypothetical protein
MRIAAAFLAVMLGAEVVRNALVIQLAENSPGAAARVWPNHPDVAISQGMTAIGAAAHRGKPADAAALSKIARAAAKAPLAPEPFLVRGVQAQVAGDAGTAQRAFLAAEWRDPRSLAARYFLADTYFRSGDARHGLPEFAALARLAPDGTVKVAPFVATYASDRANWPMLRALFRSDPPLQDVVLGTLAGNAANAEAILALADAEHRNAASPWLPSLLEKLIAAGQYRQARAVWANVAHVRTGTDALLFDPRFSNKNAPPPFTWALTSSAVGMAERQAGGRLHVIFYGQDQGVLARQLLVLAPGAYRLAMHVAGGGSHRSSLRWTLTCAGAASPTAEARLDSLGSRPWTFQVPPGCTAQWLDLIGSSSDIPQQVDVTISDLSLSKAESSG